MKLIRAILGFLQMLLPFFAGLKIAKGSQATKTVKELKKREETRKEVRDESRDDLADRITKP